MNTLQFLDHIWADEGYRCVLYLKPGTPGKFQTFYETTAEAVNRIEQLQEHSVNIFYAISTFKTDENRKQINVHRIKSFWLDIDCGKDKPYKSRYEVTQALVTFCRNTKLPPPLIINSGGGLHVYWVLDTAITAAEWRITALKLKALCTQLKFKVDPSRTSDSSSILRPIDTLNYKYNPPLIVEIQYNAPTLVYEKFKQLIDGAVEEYGATVPVSHAIFRTGALLRNVDTSLNADLMVPDLYPPSYADSIANECLQMKKCRDTRGQVSEPFWFGMIGLLKFTREAPEIIH